MTALRLAERLADIVHFHRHMIVVDDLHDVEAERRGAIAVDLPSIECGGARIPPLSMDVDGVGGAAQPRIRSCFDFNEAQDAVFAGDDVDFSIAVAHFSANDLDSDFLKRFGGEVFARIAQTEMRGTPFQFQLFVQRSAGQIEPMAQTPPCFHDDSIEHLDFS